MAPWPSGKAKVCNTSTPSPNLGGASKKKKGHLVCPFFFCLPLPLWTLHRATWRTGSSSQIRQKDVLRLRENSLANLVCVSKPSGWRCVLSFFACHSLFGLCAVRLLAHEIRFAFLSKQQSPLVSDFVGKNSLIREHWFLLFAILFVQTTVDSTQFATGGKQTNFLDALRHHFALQRRKARPLFASL